MTMNERWHAQYVLTVCGGFAALYLLTRPFLLISDGSAWVLEASLADPARTWFGFPSYFLQIPLASVVTQALQAIGLKVTAGPVFVGLSLCGTLAAVACVGLIAEVLLRTRTAAWLGALLCGASLNPWTQWNGELSGLALGFAAAGLYCTLRGRFLLPAVLWAFSVLSQINFVLAAPAFVWAVWWARGDGESVSQSLRRVIALPALAGAVCVCAFLLGSWAVGKWHDPAGLADWLQRSYSTAERSVLVRPDVFRAVKGLITAYSAAGHVVRDVFTGRSATEVPGFVPALVVGSVFLVATGILSVLAFRRRQAAVFALIWLLPFHVGFNWWWVPTEEEYHTGALPGLVLIVTAGLIELGARLSPSRRRVLYGIYVAVLLGLNLTAVILPRQSLAQDAVSSTQAVRRLVEDSQGRAVLVTCDGGNVIAVHHSGIEYLRIRSIWRGSVAEIQQSIAAWIRDRMAEGKEPYLLGRWCLPENWKTSWSKAPFDLHFLKSDFFIAPPVIVGVPTDQPSVTDPFMWKWGDIARITLPGGDGR